MSSNLNEFTIIVYAVAFVAIVAIVGIFALVATAIYLREVISVRSKAKVDTLNGTAEAEVSITDINEEAKKEPSRK